MNRNLLLVSISLFAWGLGEGLFIYFQPLYLQEWGADPLMIGAIFGAMGIAMALFQTPAGMLSDRVGPHSIMLASWLLGTMAAWIMALAKSLPMFVGGLILFGLVSFVLAPMSSYITSIRGNWSVGRALTFSAGFYNLGTVIGPICGGLIADRLGLRSVYLIAAIIFIISTIIVLFTTKTAEKHPEDEPAANNTGFLKNTRFLVFIGVSLITFFALYLPQPLTPIFLQNQQGFSRTMIGIFGAIGSLGNAVSTLALGSVAPALGFLIGQAWVLLFSIIFLLAKQPIWFGIGYFFIGGYRLSRSMVLAIARTMVNPRQTGLAYGMVETANAIAVVLAPLLAGVFYNDNPISMYIVAILLISATIIINLLGIITQRRKKVSVYET